MIKLWPIAKTTFDNIAIIRKLITEVKLRPANCHYPKAHGSEERTCENRIVESPLKYLKSRKAKQNLYTSTNGEQTIHYHLCLVIVSGKGRQITSNYPESSSIRKAGKTKPE